MKMIQVIQPAPIRHTTYFTKALRPDPIKLNFDYTQDFRDRLRKALIYNRGSSIIYGLR